MAAIPYTALRLQNWVTSLAVAVELAGRYEADAWQGHEPPDVGVEENLLVDDNKNHLKTVAR